VRVGLADPILDSQRIFRIVLDAMAHPGRILTLPPPLELPFPLSEGAAAACLAMLDFETPLWLDRVAASREVIDYLRFHCGVPVVPTPDAAAFALIADPEAMLPLEAFASGSDEYPDRSTTLILQVRVLKAGVGRGIRGPGIDGEGRLLVEGLPEHFWSMWLKNHASFPRGVDVIFTAGARVAALPRTVSAEI
jgi:alpha-D-ribose 1-methylphosphonate 5-triphosphate synthase subunit PhnH